MTRISNSPRNSVFFTTIIFISFEKWLQTLGTLNSHICRNGLNSSISYGSLKHIFHRSIDAKTQRDKDPSCLAFPSINTIRTTMCHDFFTMCKINFRRIQWIHAVIYRIYFRQIKISWLAADLRSNKLCMTSAFRSIEYE